MLFKFPDPPLINSANTIWKFYYSGQTENIDFSKLSENETTLLKFFLISFIQKNTPSHLSKKFHTFNFLINHLKNNELEFSYANLKKLLIEIAPLENHQNTYAHIKFLLKLLLKVLFGYSLKTFNFCFHSKNGFDLLSDYVAIAKTVF